MDEDNKLLFEGEKSKSLIQPAIESGPVFYCYRANGGIKFGSSFLNKKGERPLSYKCGVPNHGIHSILHMRKIDIQLVCLNIKRKYNIKGRREHADGSLDEFLTFVFDYCDLLGINYKEVSRDKLLEINLYLKRY